MFASVGVRAYVPYDDKIPTGAGERALACGLARLVRGSCGSWPGWEG